MTILDAAIRHLFGDTPPPRVDWDDPQSVRRYLAHLDASGDEPPAPTRGEEHEKDRAYEDGMRRAGLWP